MPILTVEKLCKSFGGLKAINNLDFHVDEGEIFGIIGPNGSGKTTVLNLITGVMIIAVLNNGMQLFGLPDFYQNIIKGALLLAAVGYDQYQKNRRSKEAVVRVAA
jgi:ABC-type multidrug transport system ATPase subunit